MDLLHFLLTPEDASKVHSPDHPFQGKNSFSYSLNNPRPKAVRKIGGGAMISSNSQTGLQMPLAAPRPTQKLRPNFPRNLKEESSSPPSPICPTTTTPKLSIVDFSALANRSPKKRPQPRGGHHRVRRTQKTKSSQ